MPKQHGVAASLLISLSLHGLVPNALAHELLLDRAVPVGTATSSFVTRLQAGKPGLRLVSITQTEADVQLLVTGAGGQRQNFDAPGRRAGVERACVTDDGKGFEIEIRFPGRKVISNKSVRLQVFRALPAIGAADVELEAECLESRAAGSDLTPQVRAADYERAAKLWEARRNNSRAAFAYLQSGWMLARGTSDHVAALARGLRARDAFRSSNDIRGEALAILLMTVPRVELMNAGLDAAGRKTADHSAMARSLRTDLITAIDAFERAGEPYFGAQARIQLAASHFMDGDLDTAIRLLGEAADRYQKAGEPDGETRALANRSFMIFQRGRYREAADAFDAVLASSATQDFPEVKADILDNSAATHAAVGNYDKSLSQWVEALTLHEQVGDSAGVARSLNGLASVYLSLGVPRAALEYSRRARGVLQSRDTQGRLAAEPSRLASLLLAGEAHRDLGEPAEAERAHREVLSLATSDLARTRAQLELARDAIGRNDGLGALRALDAAPAPKPGVGTYDKQIILRRAQAEMLSARPEVAVELLLPLRGQFARLGAPDLELETLDALSRAQLHRGDRRDALATSDLGIAQLKALRLVSGDSETRARLNDVYRTTYALRVEILHALRMQEKDAATRQRLQWRMFAAADEARAGLARAAGQRVSRSTPERDSLAAEIALRQKVLTGLEAAGESPSRAAILRGELAQLRARFDAAAPGQDSPLPAFDGRDYSTRGLRTDAVILMYLHSAGQLRRYVITRAGVEELEARPAPEVVRRVAAVSSQLRVPTSLIRERDPVPALRALSQLLLPPERQLAGRPLVLVVTDNITARVPFAALTSDHATYSPLVTTHDISMTLTLRDALAIAATPDREMSVDLSRLAVFSDPVFSSLDPRVNGKAKAADDAMMLTRLAATASEAKAIESIVPAGTVSSYSGFEATRERLLALAGSSTALHLATHAFASDRWPNGSGLMLSSYKPDGSALNGYISTLDLQSRGSAAQLVVLSACETARGESGSSESVAGLARAMLGSGARRVVASQWAVDDTITARMMRTFYAQLASGASAGKALSSAQRAVLADVRWRDPARWAAFMVYERAAGD